MELRALGTRSRAQRRGLGVGRGPEQGPPSTGARLQHDGQDQNTGHTESAEQRRSADRDAVSDCGGVNLKSMPGSGLRGVAPTSKGETTQ